MTTLQTKFDQLIEEQRELAKRFQETAQELFKETTKEFFDKNPAIKAVGWTQYTPYFNDGEPCTFSVNDAWFSNAEGEDLEDISRWGEYEGENEKVFCCEGYMLASTSDYGKKYRDEVHSKAEGAIDLEVLANFNRMIQCEEMEKIMLAMFGDHATIVATRDGFDVNECDHD